METLTTFIGLGVIILTIWVLYRYRLTRETWRAMREHKRARGRLRLTRFDIVMSIIMTGLLVFGFTVIDDRTTLGARIFNLVLLFSFLRWMKSRSDRLYE